MLSNLVIKNVALIKNLDIEFGSGFNVLLGETGAGKSIIFDALNFVIGGKADKTLIRSGEDTMKVDAVFTDLDKTVISFLEEQDCDTEELIISRSYNMDGKGGVKVNGSPMPLSLLKTLGGLLVDTYSQHDSMELLNNKKHLSILDKFGGEEIEKLKIEFAGVLGKYNDLKRKLKTLGGDESERERLKEILKFQIQEIENAKLNIGEEEEIRERIKFLSSAEKIYESLSESDNLLNGDFSVINNLGQVKNLLSTLSEFEEIDSCKERISSVIYELEDIVESLEDIKNKTEFDENELNSLDSRLDLIKSLNKKYGGSIEEVLKFYDDISSRYDDLTNSEELLVKIENEINLTMKQLVVIGEKLTSKRKESAKVLEQKLMNELEDLSMKGTLFEVEFEKCDEPTSEGFDVVKFVFSANKGQDLKDLSKVASGGELSRLMLAFKNIFNDNNKTVVFDEIDSGISGEVGNKVAEKLANLSKQSQILCITHMPQVASAGDNYLYVGKFVEDNQTYTNVKKLNDDEEIDNIARLIGGDNLTEIAIKHAREMKDRYKTYKESK